MTITELGALGEFVGAIAVVATLLPRDSSPAVETSDPCSYRICTG